MKIESHKQKIERFEKTIAKLDISEDSETLICQKYTISLFDRWTKSNTVGDYGIFLSMLKNHPNIEVA